MIELTRSDAAARARAFNSKWGKNLASPEWYKQSGYELVSDSVDAALNPARTARAIYLAYELPASDPLKQAAFETSFQSMTRYLEVSLGLTLVGGISRRMPIGRHSGTSQGICLAQHYWTYPCVKAANKLVRGIRYIWEHRPKLSALVKSSPKPVSSNPSPTSSATQLAIVNSNASTRPHNYTFSSRGDRTHIQELNFSSGLPVDQISSVISSTRTPNNNDKKEFDDTVKRRLIALEVDKIYDQLYDRALEMTEERLRQRTLILGFNETHFSIMMDELDRSADQMEDNGQIDIAEGIRKIKQKTREDWNRQVERIQHNMRTDPSFGKF